MTEKLLPCGHCGKSDTGHVSDCRDAEYYIRCHGCGATGGEASDD